MYVMKDSVSKGGNGGGTGWVRAEREEGSKIDNLGFITASPS